MKFGSLLFLTLGGLGVLPGWSVEPPLPGEDGPRTETQAFQPLLKPGDVLPPGSEAPPVPEGPAVLPPELFPDGPVAGDADPSAMLPEMPGLDPGGIPGLPPTQGEGPSLLPPPAVAPSIPGLEMAARAYWHKSPREAREVSKKERKPLLLFFYQKWKSAPAAAQGAVGGDNNISINDDLLSTPEFNEFMASRVVLTRLFYPINPGKDFPPERLAALQHFREYFKVKTLPTILLLDENGHEIERQKGYSRLKPSRGVELTAAQPILERFKVAVQRRESAIAAMDEKRNRLLAQNYRDWTSQTGNTLLAKFVGVTGGQIVLRDDTGALRYVLPEQLSIVDQAVIHRQQKGEAWKVGQLEISAGAAGR